MTVLQNVDNVHVTMHTLDVADVVAVGDANKMVIKFKILNYMIPHND